MVGHLLYMDSRRVNGAAFDVSFRCHYFRAGFCFQHPSLKFKMCVVYNIIYVCVKSDLKWDFECSVEYKHRFLDFS